MTSDWRCGFFWGWIAMVIGQLVGAFVLWCMGKLVITWG